MERGPEFSVENYQRGQYVKIKISLVKLHKKNGAFHFGAENKKHHPYVVFARDLWETGVWMERCSLGCLLSLNALTAL